MAFRVSLSQFYISRLTESITFEPIPADYSILTLHTLPPTGGDTLWASGYEVYDRLSPTWQRFVDGLTATYSQPGFLKSANDHGFKLHTAPRGAPENVGEKLEAVHPVRLTQPQHKLPDWFLTRF